MTRTILFTWKTSDINSLLLSPHTGLGITGGEQHLYFSAAICDPIYRENRNMQ